MKKKAYTMDTTVYKVTTNNIERRMTDIVKHDSFYSGRLIFDDGSIGKMVHRITMEEMESAIKENEKP